MTERKKNSKVTNRKIPPSIGNNNRYYLASIPDQDQRTLALN